MSDEKKIKIKMLQSVCSSIGNFQEGKEYEVTERKIIEAWVQAGLCEAEGIEKVVKTTRTAKGETVETRTEPEGEGKTEPKAVEQEKPEKNKK